jgi:hypothetical protein
MMTEKLVNELQVRGAPEIHLARRQFLIFLSM